MNLLLCFAVCHLGCDVFCRGSELETVSHIAKTRHRSQGTPRYSDVVMRSLQLHPFNDKDPHDTFHAIRDFHVTRLEWVYGLNKQSISEVQALGVYCGAALHSALSDMPNTHSRKVGRIKNNLGEPMTAPWMEDWVPKRYWGCANSPEYCRSFVMHAKVYLDAGIDGLHVDDPDMNDHASSWGGCFCKYCMAKFPEYLARHLTKEQMLQLNVSSLRQFDYKQYAKSSENVPDWLKKLFTDFQMESVALFYEDVLARIDRDAERHVPISFNYYIGADKPYTEHFDYGIRELHLRSAKPTAIRQRILSAAKQGKSQVLTIPKEFTTEIKPVDVALNRKCIATSYAMGGLTMVPWDICMSLGKTRYFGTVAEYGDLYAFVRQNAQYFDGYEDAAVTGNGLTDERYSSMPPVQIAGGSDRVLACVRALPGELSAHVVIHLVDWSDRTESLTIRLNSERFFRENELLLQLRQPKCAPREIPIDQNGDVVIPPLDPWGVIIVSLGSERR